jgi:hypothetical protein
VPHGFTAERSLWEADRLVTRIDRGVVSLVAEQGALKPPGRAGELGQEEPDVARRVSFPISVLCPDLTDTRPAAPRR